MRQWIALGAALAIALLAAIWAVHPPAPLPADAPADRFSAARAMADVRAIARAPHTTGSAENARVRDYLAMRMEQLGLEVERHGFALADRSIERLRKWDPQSQVTTGENLIGILPGRDRSKPALLLMGHHDTVWGSPGAADDSAGIAAALEIARALKAGPQPERDVVLLFTDAEELGLDGARAFFAGHPLARRIGVIVNMETRGGGGRAAMFETGPGNAGLVDLFQRAVRRPSGNSLAVLVYRNMPNDTDYSEARDRGVPGFNFAFMGRSGLYHSPMATPDAIDPGSIQDVGSQALDLSRAIAGAEDLPARGPDKSFGDVLGLVTFAYTAAFGWVLLAIAAALAGFAAWRVRREGLVGAASFGSGLATALALPLHAALLLKLLNLVSGSGPGSNYYDRLASIPRLEIQALLACLAALLLAAALRRQDARAVAALPALLLTALVLLLGGWSMVIAILGLIAAAAALFLPRERAGVWPGWLGLLALVLLIATAAQFLAPTASPALAWPLLLGAAMAALAAALDPKLERAPVQIALIVLAGLGTAHIFYLGHLTFLGVGAPMAEVMAVYLLLAALLLWPLAGAAIHARRAAAILAAVLLVAALGLALSVRLDPMAATIPPYTDKP